jgi:hypothetical protein
MLNDISAVADVVFIIPLTERPGVAVETLHLYVGSKMVKGKVVPVLPLTYHHAMKGVEVQLHPFLDVGIGRR